MSFKPVNDVSAFMRKSQVFSDYGKDKSVAVFMEKTMSEQERSVKNLKEKSDSLSQEEYYGEIQKIPIIIVFAYLDWCGHCKTAAPIVDEAMKRMKRNAEQKMICISTSALNDMSAKWIVSKTNSTGFPQLIMIDHDGNICKGSVRSVDDCLLSLQQCNLMD